MTLDEMVKRSGRCGSREAEIVIYKRVVRETSDFWKMHDRSDHTKGDLEPSPPVDDGGIMR